MDEQMIADMRDAIDRNVTWQTGEVFKGNRQCVNYLEVARAAHSVMAGKVAEMERGLREARPYLEPARLREDANARELLIDRCPVREICKRIDAALAPYPERRSE